jgi:hypothetical protein
MIFAEYDHGYSQRSATGYDIHRGWITFGGGGQSVGVEDQRHISESIFSESSSIRRVGLLMEGLWSWRAY